MIIKKFRPEYRRKAGECILHMPVMACLLVIAALLAQGQLLMWLK